jgi:hypothetical protein
VKKLREYRIALQELAKMPETIAVASALANVAALTSGWILAGKRGRTIADMEAVDAMTDGWCTIKVTPDMMEKIEDGATLLYRQKRLDENNLYTQLSTNGKFSEAMDQKFENVSMDDVLRWERKEGETS